MLKANGVKSCLVCALPLGFDLKSIHRNIKRSSENPISSFQTTFRFIQHLYFFALPLPLAGLAGALFNWAVAVWSNTQDLVMMLSTTWF